MTLLKDNNYKDINIALLSLENDIKNKVVNVDSSSISVINAQIADINRRINEINSSNNSAEITSSINELKVSIENLRLELTQELNKTTTTANTALNKANEATTIASGAKVTADNANTKADDALNKVEEAMPKSGGQFTGPISLPPNQYDGNFGINMRNSDIKGINALIMADTADDDTEGIKWVKSDGTTETLRAKDGKLMLGGEELAYNYTDYPNWGTKAEITITDFLKRYANNKAGVLYSRSSWSWAEDRYIRLNCGVIISTMSYSCLVVRQGNLNSAWNLTAVVFFPSFFDYSSTYIVMGCTNETPEQLIIKEFRIPATVLQPTADEPIPDGPTI